MLVFDERLLKVTRLNEIVAPIYGAYDEFREDDPIGYIYCDLATYQQAVTLSVRFEDDVESLESSLLMSVNHTEAISKWKMAAPKPFDMLAPYIGLISDKVNVGLDMEELTSYLHVIGKSINFSEFIAIPRAARVNVLFGKSSFLMMKEEIRDYKRTLREKERDVYGDDVTWVSTEEIGRVMLVAGEILKTLPNYKSADITEPAAADVSSKTEDSVDTMIDEDDDWSDYVPPAPISMDWGVESSPMVQAAIQTVKKDAIEKAGNEDVSVKEADLLDQLMAGTTNSYNV